MTRLTNQEVEPQNENEPKQQPEKTDANPETKKDKLARKDIITLCISIAALLMSAYTFIANNFLNQHALKASVVSIGSTKDSLKCTILLVNSGKSYETVYAAQFIFSDNLNKGGGSLSPEAIGPFVIPPNQAMIATLTTKSPDIKEFWEDGTVSKDSTHIHTGVQFDIIDKKGSLPEVGKIFKFTRLSFDAAANRTGTKPMEGDNKGMIDLL